MIYNNNSVKNNAFVLHLFLMESKHTHLFGIVLFCGPACVLQSKCLTQRIRTAPLC